MNLTHFPILQLRSGRDKSVKNRHPWIFSGALKQKPVADEGDVVEVRAAGGEILGYGFYSGKSQISCRMFWWEQRPEIFASSGFWKEKLKNALTLREKLIDPYQTNAFRLLHAEGDFLPGLIADVYAETLVLQMLIKGIENYKDHLIEAFVELGFKNIFLKTKGSSVHIEDIETYSGWLAGGGNGNIRIKEHGFQFEVNFVKGQKTGFFLDQRENRALVRSFAAGKDVLNAFSYSGGFSVYAAGGGAQTVTSVDISQEAIALADQNIGLNLLGFPHQGIAGDCFEFLKEMPENAYDVIILDPPAFAKHARAVENASRGYKQINLKAFQKIRPQGLLFTFSCSQNISPELFRKIVFAAAADSGRNVRILQHLHQPADHPVNIYHPEGEYLKGLLLYVE